MNFKIDPDLLQSIVDKKWVDPSDDDPTGIVSAYNLASTSRDSLKNILGHNYDKLKPDVQNSLLEMSTSYGGTDADSVRNYLSGISGGDLDSARSIARRHLIDENDYNSFHERYISPREQKKSILDTPKPKLIQDDTKKLENPYASESPLLARFLAGGKEVDIEKGKTALATLIGIGATAVGKRKASMNRLTKEEIKDALIHKADLLQELETLKLRIHEASRGGDPLTPGETRMYLETQRVLKDSGNAIYRYLKNIKTPEGTGGVPTGRRVAQSPPMHGNITGKIKTKKATQRGSEWGQEVRRTITEMEDFDLYDMTFNNKSLNEPAVVKEFALEELTHRIKNSDFSKEEKDALFKELTAMRDNFAPDLYKGKDIKDIPTRGAEKAYSEVEFIHKERQLFRQRKIQNRKQSNLKIVKPEE